MGGGGIRSWRFSEGRDQGPIMRWRQWIDHHGRTRLTIGVGNKPSAIGRAGTRERAVSVCSPDAREELVRLGDCVVVVAENLLLCDAVYREKPGKAEINARANELLGWLVAHFKSKSPNPTAAFRFWRTWYAVWRKG